jgi:glutamyl-tRNA reductase
MSMSLICLGISHKTAPVALRERLAISEERQSEVLHRVGASPAEALFVSTCSRVELYRFGMGEELAEPLRAELLALGGEEALGHAYLHRGEAALLHLFRVTSSLDSMVVGEPQILGQVKDAFEFAKGLGAARGELGRVFAAAFSAAKRVRTETDVGRAATSMAAVAVQLASKIFGGLDGKTVLLVGAGEMSELAGRHLVAAGAHRLLVTNRTPERAEALAQLLGGNALAFESLGQALCAADVVVCSTASPVPFITRDLVAGTLRARRHRPLFLVDLAVPRDVEPEVNALDNVYAYDVDDIQKVLAENSALRTDAAVRAETLVAEDVARFVRERAVREGVPVLAQLRARAEAIRKAELERALANLPTPLTAAQEEVVTAMTAAIVNKMLHQPTVKLRAVLPGDAVSPLADAVAELFGLDPASRRSGSGSGES